MLAVSGPLPIPHTEPRLADALEARPVSEWSHLMALGLIGQCVPMTERMAIYSLMGTSLVIPVDHDVDRSYNVHDINCIVESIIRFINIFIGMILTSGSVAASSGVIVSCLLRLMTRTPAYKYDEQASRLWRAFSSSLPSSQSRNFETSYFIVFDVEPLGITELLSLTTIDLGRHPQITSYGTVAESRKPPS